MERKISLIAADVDGTLVVKGGNLMEKTRKAINELHKRGILFGIASGRPVDRRISGYAQDWDLDFDFDFVIGTNGGELYEKKSGVTEKFYPLSRETLKEILDMLSAIGANAIIYRNGYDDIYALKFDEFLRQSQGRNQSHITIGTPEELAKEPAGKIEVHMHPSKKAEFLKLVQQHASKDYTYIQTFEVADHCTIEFMDPRVNKGLALHRLSEKTGIPMEEIMAIGDMDNDFALLKEAGVAVCMKNGCDACKEIADDITEYDVFHDGVGEYLYSTLLK